MSENIEIYKDIDIDVDGVECTVRKAINIQVDYVECGECGKELGFSICADNWGDLQITADRCDCGELKG